MILIGRITALDTERFKGKITTDEGRLLFRCKAMQEDQGLRNQLISMMLTGRTVQIHVDERWNATHIRTTPYVKREGHNVERSS
jgi:hypothetical protein